MNAEKKSRGGMTAAELMAQLENDEEYQRKRAIRQAEQEVLARALSLAEQPIVADLNDAGVHVDSVWSLVNTSEPYPLALPVLIHHLELGGYPDRVMEGIGRALAVGPAAIYWDRFRRLFVRARAEDEKDGLAVAMAASAKPEHLEAMIEILADPSWGDYRVYFVRPILRVGGVHGRQAIESLRDDPLLGKEAAARLRTRKH